MATRGNLRAVGAAIDQAKPAPRLARKREDDQRELPLLPAGCPVRPLGKLGQVCFYLDEAGQMIGLNPRDHGKTHIINMFGRQAGLCREFWPRYGPPDKETGEPRITGWMPELAAELLMAACAHEGLFDPQGKVRGRGAHLGEDGSLILHCGDTVFRSGMPPGLAYQEPGLIDGFVYPTAPASPRPDPEPAGDEVGVELLSLLRSWYWERPKIDPYLLLGFIPAAMAGGALGWRPHVWVTGDTETGKSTLEKKVLAWLFEGASLRTHQATEAALRQTIKQQTLPVFFDELEAEENSQRAAAVIGLARLASSGGVIFKGGQDHQAHEFTAQNCFYFSSILLPHMLNQDRNRLAILELKRIPEGATEPRIEREDMIRMGRRIRRRLVDQWHRFEETLRAYRSALAKTGHSGRSRDQFGTLLACADLLLYDHVPDAEVLGEWADALRADAFAETSDNSSDSEEACQFLATSMLQLRGGDEPEPISRFLERAIGGKPGTPTLIADEAMDRARERLENHGLKIVSAVPPKEEGKPWGAKEPAPGEDLYVAIASSHEALARLFRDKRWARGVWSQTFARVPGAKRRAQTRFAGRSLKATLVPIAALIEREEVT